jgi:urease alpha subunit
MIFKRILGVSFRVLGITTAVILDMVIIGSVVAEAPPLDQPLKAEPHLDVAIRGGQIVDGTGAPWYRADIGIRDGKIVTIGRLSDDEAKRTIEASGLVVSPGFIDMMGQSATSLLDSPNNAMNLLSQGITTINLAKGCQPRRSTGRKANRWGGRRCVNTSLCLI